MVRLIIDNLSDGHQDLFMKIDLMPSYTQVADSYYLFDFLEITDTENYSLSDGVKQLIQLWEEIVQSIQEEEIFLPFDFSDQYVGGLFLNKVKLGYKIRYAFTPRIQGWGLTKSNLDTLTKEHKGSFIDEGREWLIGENILYNGFEWSKKELEPSSSNQGFKLIYQTIEGIPEPSVIQQLLRVYDQLFEDARLDFFVERIHAKEDLIINLCYNTSELIGFKVGYQYDENTLYSWVGGVLSEYRNQGIARKLMELQHEVAKKKGYEKVRTKSMNRFKSMIILNLKNGFDIQQVYTNDSDQTKIIFEKELS